MFSADSLDEITGLLERSKLYRYLGGKWILNTASFDDFERLKEGWEFETEDGVMTIAIRVATDVSSWFMRGETKWYDANLPSQLWPICDDIQGVTIPA